MTPAPETVDAVIQAIGLICPRAGERARSDSCLEADLALDNIARISLALEIEDHFGIEMKDAEVYDWDTVGDIAVTIERKVAGRARERAA